MRAAKTRRLFKVKGSSIVIWKTSGRHDTCGHTSTPRARAASCSAMTRSWYGRPFTVSSAVQVMGRPTSSCRVKSWSLEKTPPGSSAITPLPALRSGSSSARSSARSPTRDGTGRPWSPLCVGEALEANPMAPASRAPATVACMAVSSASVAGRS